MSGVARQIRDDQRRHHAHRRAGNAVQDLHDHQQMRVADKGDQDAADGQGHEAEQEHQSPAAKLRLPADPGRGHGHDDLRRDDARRDEHGRHLLERMVTTPAISGSMALLAR